MSSPLILLPFGALGAAPQLSGANAIDLSPAFIPAYAAGWSREYVQVASESFNTPSWAPASGFALGEVGRFSDEGWVIGRSTGERPYLNLYRSDPSSLPLKPGGCYEMRFTYRIEEELDQGFTFLFYSQTGGAANDWIPDLIVKDPTGKTGRGCDQRHAGHGGAGRLYRRDFEHGVVLVNATKEKIEFSPEDLAGALARRGLKRIKGRFDPQNDGRPVTGALTLEAADAVVLIAERP